MSPCLGCVPACIAPTLDLRLDSMHDPSRRDDWCGMLRRGRNEKPVEEKERKNLAGPLRAANKLGRLKVAEGNRVDATNLPPRSRSIIRRGSSHWRFRVSFTTILCHPQFSHFVTMLRTISWRAQPRCLRVSPVIHSRSLASISSGGLLNPNTVGPYQVFDRRAKRLQKDRSALRDDGERSRTVDYVRDEVADRLIERLMVW